MIRAKRCLPALPALLVFAQLLADAPTLPAHQPGRIAQEAPLQHYRQVETWQADAQPAAIHSPGGVDVSTEGLAYLAETGRNAISIWRMDDGSGGMAFGAPKAGDEAPIAPEDLAVDEAAGRVYVADTGRRRVLVLQRSWAGTAPRLDFEASWPGMGRPRGITLGPDGRVYVSDYEGHRILVMDAAGRRLAELGGFGRGPGQLDGPLGLAIGPRDGLLYVADSGNRRVLRWRTDGRPMGELALDGRTGPGGIPLDLIQDLEGRLQVAVERGVLRFDPRGAYIDRLQPLLHTRPQPEWLLGNHEGLRGLGFDPQGGQAIAYAPALWADDGLDLLPAKALPNRTGGLGRPAAGIMVHPYRIAFDPAYRQAVVLDASRQLGVYRRGGERLVASDTQGFGSLPGAADPRYPDLAASEGRVALLGGNQVGIFASDGSGMIGQPMEVLGERMRQRRDPSGRLVPDRGWWNSALAYARQPGGDAIAVLEAGHARLILLTGTGLLLRAVDLPQASAEFRLYRDLAFDQRGGLWVLAREGIVLPVDATGRVGAEIRMRGLAPRAAEALAVDAAGRFFVLSADGWVFGYSADGSPFAAFSVAKDAAGHAIGHADLAVDDQGQILISDSEADRIRVYAPAVGEDADPLPDPEKARAALDLVLLLDAGCGTADGRLAALRAAGQRLAAAMTQGQDHVALIGYAPERDGSLGGGLGAGADAGAEENTNTDAGASSGGARLILPFTADRDALRRAMAEFQPACPARGVSVGESAGGHITSEPSESGQATSGLTASKPAESDPTALAAGLRLARDSLEGPLGRPEAGKAVLLLAAGSDERELALWEARRLWRGVIELWTLALGPEPDSAGEPADRALLAALADRPSHYSLVAEPAELPARLEEIGRRLSSRPRLPATPGISTATPSAGSATPSPSTDPGGATEPASGGWLPPGSWGQRLFLPLLQHGRCQPTASPRDIVLLIDGSEAMSGDKLEAARGAGRALLNALDLGRDRVAVLSYSAEARLIQGMSDDPDLLATAIEALAAGSGSRLDLGLWAALEILSGPALRDNAAPVILLLTAGRPEPGREPALREAARLGRAMGASVEIVVYGEDLPLALLGEIAGAPSRLYPALDAGDLAARFFEIAGRAPCP